ncbi:MAG: Fur family transcriptional regulator [Cyanobacteria bacterium P01_E01_bin.6]
MSAYSLELLREELNKRGFRLTNQRQEILEIFQAVPQGRHLSAEELHAVLKKNGSRVSLSTVYRTLHVMTYMGILRELELAEGHKHYELNLPNPGQHHHLVCVHCNRTLEFENTFVTQIGMKQAQVSGYHLLDCQLTIFGVCPEAVKAGWGETLSKDWSCERSIQEEQSL